MSYRDDHEAALRRIADLERRLEEERAAHAADEGRVAALEKELAALRRELPPKPAEQPAAKPKQGKSDKPKEPKPRPSSRFPTVMSVLALVAVVGLFTFFMGRGCLRASYDGSQWLAVAIDEARGWAPDAELSRMEGMLIDSHGKADSTYNGRWLFVFRSQSRALVPRPVAPPAPVPGAPPPKAPPWPGCQYTCDVTLWRKGGWKISCSEGRPQSADCGSSLAAPVRCPVKQVWQKARERGAPDPALANVMLLPVGGAWQWRFTVLDRAAQRQVPLFATELADDCGDGAARGTLAPR